MPPPREKPILGRPAAGRVPDVMSRRLAAQHVARPALASPRAVVAHLGALQAQDHAAALWAIGLRMRKPCLAAIERAIAKGEILRTWPMRGTLHFVAAKDARALVALLAPRAMARAAGRRRELGLTDATLEKAREALVRALRREGALARPDAYETLERAGIATRGQRGIHILGHLAQEGTLCLGPHEGKQPTFVLLDAVATGPADALSLADVARRYVASHGPASAADFAWWTGATMTDARAALAAADLRETAEGWTTPRPRVAAEPTPGAHLMPAFDEIAVAYKDRSAALARVGALANAQIGLLSPCILLDGQMVGTWGRTLQGDRMRVQLKPLVRWSAAEQDAIEADAQRFADFLGARLELRVEPTRAALPDRVTTRA